MFISFEATWHLWDKQVFPVSISQKKKKNTPKLNDCKQ